MIDIDQPFNLVVGYISSTLKVTLQFRKVKKLAAALLPLRGSVFLGARYIAYKYLKIHVKIERT